MSVDDSAVLGTGVLFVLSLWLLLVTRRENHTIGFLLRDTDSPEPDGSPSNDASPEVKSHGQRWLILQSILANSLFVTVDETLASVDSLESAPRRAGHRRVNDALSKAGFAAARSFFFLFPVITALFVFGIDRRSYFIPDPFEPGAKIPGTGSFYWESTIIFVFCWIPLAACCLRAKRYSTATERVLRDYGRKLRQDLSSES